VGFKIPSKFVEYVICEGAHMYRIRRVLLVRLLAGIGAVLAFLTFAVGFDLGSPDHPQQLEGFQGAIDVSLGLILPLGLWATAAFVAFGTNRRRPDALSQPPLKDGDQAAKLAAIIRIIADLHAEALDKKSDEEAAAFLQSILDQYDIVYGVWNDPRGSGSTPMKGYGLVRDALHSADMGTLRISAVPCTREQGIAAMERHHRMKY
jgi:hypothetical protein